MYPKPEKHAKVKARRRRTYAQERASCVRAVWKRAGHRCEECFWWVEKPSETDQPLTVGHVHEVIPRSRGGSPTDPDNCRLLCARKCHPEAHGLRVGHG